MAHVGVVFGGRSVEHQVSIRSARTVVQGLRAAGHQVTPLGIAQDGCWIDAEASEAVLSGGIATIAPLDMPVAPTLRHLLASGSEVLFPIVHGTWGEDGTLQGLCEMIDVAYVGPGVTASALAMDKLLFKRQMEAAGVPVVEYEAVRRADSLALAPVPLRLAAGVVDMAPLIVAFFILGRGNATPEHVQHRMTHLTPEMMWVLGAFAVYLLHTTIAELLVRRSLGKILFGLRVVALDGTPAGPLAVVARNLFRIFDVILIFPLTLVIFSPLRQRVGDVAAGTIVVRNEPQRTEDQPSET